MGNYLVVEVVEGNCRIVVVAVAVVVGRSREYRMLLDKSF